MKLHLCNDNSWVNHDYTYDKPFIIVDDDMEIREILKIKNDYYRAFLIDFNNNYAVIRKIKLNKNPNSQNDTQYIKCPYCGYEDCDSWEAGDSSDSNKCGRCGLLFSYDRYVEITYTSNPIEQKINIINIEEDNHETTKTINP